MLVQVTRELQKGGMLGDSDDEKLKIFRTRTSGPMREWNTEIVISSGFLLHKNVEGNGMGHCGSKFSSPCSVASCIFLEKHAVVDKSEVQVA